MEIFIDLSAIPTSNPILFAWWFAKTIGWIYPVFLFVYALILVWQNYIRDKYRKERKYILLAIDIPKNNEQTPRAVENIFSHLAGAHQPLGFTDKWWFGEVPNSFSFEIISVGGYIQFIIHTCDNYRDLIEAIIYAQYPDAEIMEVEDYTKDWNIKFPNEKYDLVGTEIRLAKNYAYPIITYKEFEDSISQEIKDPMASMLEALTRIGQGEQIWIQFVTTPADNDWGEIARPVVNKIIGAKNTGGKKNIFDYIYEIPINLLNSLNNAASSQENSSSKEDAPNQMLYLTQGQKDAVSAIEHKASKVGFHVRIRFIYFAEKTVFFKTRGVQNIYGAFKQYNDLGLNSFKPDSKIATWGIVWFKKMRLNSRKNKIFQRYKNRGHWLSPGEFGFILNTEEMATLWHFPLMTVKAPLVKKTDAKKAEPPMSLPIENLVDTDDKIKIYKKGSAPPNIPTS